MKHTSAITLSILLTCFLVACKDKEPNPNTSSCVTNPGSCQSISAAKDFFLFKIGSWWVYEEETSHVRDSMYVTQYNNTTTYDFHMRIESGLDGYLYDFWPVALHNVQGCSETGAVARKCVFIKRSKGKQGDFVAESYAFFVQYNLGDSLGSFNNHYDNNRIYISEKLPAYAIDNNTFGETVKIYEPHTAQEHDQTTHHYYSRGVGLIRKELLDSNQVWNLVNYHIEE